MRTVCTPCMRILRSYFVWIFFPYFEVTFKWYYETIAWQCENAEPKCNKREHRNMKIKKKKQKSQQIVLVNLESQNENQNNTKKTYSYRAYIDYYHNSLLRRSVFGVQCSCQCTHILEGKKKRTNFNKIRSRTDVLIWTHSWYINLYMK